MHLEVDGQVQKPITRGLHARFLLPVGAREFILVSPTSVPRTAATGVRSGWPIGEIAVITRSMSRSSLARVRPQ